MRNLYFILLGLLMMACSNLDEEPRSREAKPRPLMKFEEETVLENYEDSILQWRLRTQYLERWAGSERIFVKPIDVDIFDSLGVKVAFLRADSGSLDTKMTFINAYGHVHAHSPEGASVRADSLTWSKADNRVQTLSPVRVVTPQGDVLAGVGFISDSKLNQWEILKDVRGIFQDAGVRLKEDNSPKQKTTSNKKSAPSKKVTQKPIPKPSPPRSTAMRSQAANPPNDLDSNEQMISGTKKTRKTLFNLMKKQKKQANE